MPRPDQGRPVARPAPAACGPYGAGPFVTRGVAGRYLLTTVVVSLSAFSVMYFIRLWAGTTETGGVPGAHPFWVTVAALLFALHAGAALLVWQSALGLGGPPVQWSTALDTFAPGLLAKYVPGKIWSHAARLGMAGRTGMKYGKAAGAFIWEAILGLAAASAFATVGLGIAGSREAWTVALPLLIACVLAVLALRVLPQTVWVARLSASRGWAFSSVAPRALSRLALLNLLAWTIYVGAHLALVLSLGAIDTWALARVAGAVGLAWAAGYLAIVMPAGFGVRDGLLLVLLGPVLPQSAILAFVLLARLVPIGVETMLTVGWLTLRRGRRLDATPPSS